MLLVKGGKLVSHKLSVRADLLIDDKGRISKVSSSISARGAQIIDASGLFILPGAIDSHVHFRDPEDTSKEDFSTGSASALAGGVTAVMDMPNYRNPPTTTLAAYSEKLRIASSKSRCDFLLRFGASETNQGQAAASNAPSLKIFLTDTRSELGCSKGAAVAHFKSFPPRKPVCVHAEDRDRIADRAGRFKEHERVRDKLVSQIACEFALREAGRLSRRVHICHLTTALEVGMCRRYPNATYEINPAHLFLSSSDLERLGELGRINPPLRDKREVAALWRSIGSDTIIATDHAPHLPAHKMAGAPGFPGVGTMLPLLINAAHERRLSLPQIAAMCSYNPARAFGLASKGELAQGKDADFVLVDMGKKWEITGKNRLSKCGWTPFEGKEVFGKISAVYLRGSLAYDGDSVLSKIGSGKELACSF